MILQALNDLYSRLRSDERYQIAPFGYSQQKVTFKVVLYADGRLFEIQDARQILKGLPRPRRLVVPGDAKPPGAGMNPCFLWDNTAYLLGFKPDDPKPERTAKSFEAFRERHLALNHEIACDDFAAVCRFLESWRAAEAQEYPALGVAGPGFGVFQIKDTPAYVHEHPAVQAWWSTHLDARTGTPTAQCLVTGEELPVAVTHSKVRGLRGALVAGAVVVGFNESAYESYGKSQSENAPVSVTAAFQYTAAVNSLLDGPKSEKHSISLGDATVLFWTDQATMTEDVFAHLISWGSLPLLETDEARDEGTRKKLEVFMGALRKGENPCRELESEQHTGC